MCTNASADCPSNITGLTGVFPVCVYSFIFIVGLVFNVLALVFFCCQTKSRSQTIVYMTNLAVADVLLTLTLPTRIYYHLGYAVHYQWLCEVHGLVLKANMYGSIFLLTCICFDRCMAVSFPMSSRVQAGRKKAPLICLVIWMLTFGASLPIYLFQLKTRNTIPKDCFDSPPVFATKPVVVIPTLFLGFSIPLVIMLLCSWGLVRAVRQSSVAQTNMVDSRKIQRMIATSLLIFLLSFLPYHATLVLLSVYAENPPYPMQAAYRYSLMLASLNSVLDPIAYYFTTDTFRQKLNIGAFWRMFPLNSQSSDVNNRGRMLNS
ncbi:lysophosphatidic acid receptor 6 [Etheostoma spectabile]|uniref:lysophosphatidic acid receptor 6 n=1 Tax=Etheostoma spectabile TaxID=54343 RepID=UPI0013AECDA0|nr:lysophosphatidic acid receptor 6-like [Etheostoma spectabile]